MVGGAGKGHDKEHGSEPAEPGGVHLGHNQKKQLCDNAFGTVDEFIACGQHHAAVDQGGHVGQL